MSSPSRTLYEIGSDLAEIETLLLDIGGDVTDTDVDFLIDCYLAETRTELDAKLDNYCGLIQELNARAKARDEEAKRLAARARIDTNASERLKARLFAFFGTHNITTRETARFRINVQLNGGALPLIVTDPEHVPEDYVKVKVEPDNATIRAALEAGKVLEFAHLADRGKHLRIR